MKDSLEPISQVGVYGGAGVTVIGWFTLTEWLAMAGFTVALLSFFVNWYYKREMLEIAKGEK